MTLPASGTLTLLEIKNRYGGPGNLKSYYYGGSYVTSNSSNGSGHTIPSSGVIAQANFYGAGYFTPVTFSSGTPGSGSNAVPHGATTACVEIVGGSGGGSNCSTTSSSPTFGPGSGGGYATINVAVTSGQTFNFVIGTGGSGGVASGTAGGNGTITTLTGPGSLSMNALPGYGASVSGSGSTQTTTRGAAGTANGSAGVTTVSGTQGSTGQYSYAGSVGYISGLPFQQIINGVPGVNNELAGSGGDAIPLAGGGGGGMVATNTYTQGRGGNGGNGAVVITYT